MPILAFVFAATWTVAGAMAAHLPAMLQAAGATTALAIAAAALIGPSQVAARLLEASRRNYWTPDAATLEALERAGEELEDRLEGVWEGAPA